MILDEVVHGNCDPKQLAQLAKASLKNKKAELTASLSGFYSEHFRWLLSEAMQELADLDRKLEQIDKRLAKQLQPHADLILRLCTIPGVDFTTAAVILAEIGFDMSRFPDPAHLAKLGWIMPRQQRKCWQTLLRLHLQGEPVSATNSDAKPLVVDV